MALSKRTFSIAAGAGVAIANPAGLFGIQVREVTGVAAPGTLQVYDNAAAAAGTIICTIRLAADGELQFNWDAGVRIQNGLFVQATGADIAGCLAVGSGAALRPLPFAGADLLLYTGAVDVESVMAAETAGAAAEWRVFDNTAIAGNAFVGGVCAANETQRFQWPRDLHMDTGLFFDQVSGAVSGNVYVH